MGSYKINVNNLKKEMEVEVEGNLTEQQAADFISEYQTKTGRIKPTEYSLRLDCSAMNIVTAELVPPLEHCFKLYKSSNFQKVLVEVNGSYPILERQLSRLLKKTDLKGEFVKK